MFHPEAMPVPPATDPDKVAEAEKIESAPPVLSEREFIDDAEKQGADIPDTVLSPDMSAEETVALAGRLVAELEAKRRQTSQEHLRQTIHDQRLMIAEELARHAEAPDGSLTEPPLLFSQNRMGAREPKTLEWILTRLEHIPGGKKAFGALTLVVGLSALPEPAEARGRDNRGGIFDGVTETIERSINQEIRRGANDAIRQPRREFDKAMREQNQRERQAELGVQRQEQAAEQYIAQVAREVTAFKQSFDNTALRRFRTAPDRDNALLQVVSRTLHNLEQRDNQYLARYGAAAYGLSDTAKAALQNFAREVQSGKYSDAKWVPNPLQDLALEDFVPRHSPADRY